VLNRNGRGVGISNQVQVSTAPALASPANLSTSLSDAGVTLTWKAANVQSVPGVSFVYRISRRGETGDFVAIATVPVDQPSYTDQGTEWEKKSEYRIAALTQTADGKQTLVEGDDSSAVSILAHDVFPPKPPTELQAVFSGPGQQAFIDLSWTPNVEPDLAGYNVYRHEEGAEAVRVNPSLVTSPSFRDQQIAAGKQYFYSITAVDARGNESAKSAETSETVP
jgi:predicted phage tail protein